MSEVENVDRVSEQPYMLSVPQDSGFPKVWERVSQFPIISKVVQGQDREAWLSHPLWSRHDEASPRAQLGLLSTSHISPECSDWPPSLSR